jgi:DNA replication and repair protein RecF
VSYLTQLQLSHYRCYEAARVENLSSGLIVLSGPNGAGKTNILEAVSLLTPGRGLRGASMDDLQRRDSPHPWAISGAAETGGATVQVGTGLDPATGRRIVRINGALAKSQMALADYLSCIWLTPQMDRLFMDGSGGRRRFLDKLVFAFDPGHAGRVTRYENAMAPALQDIT